MISTMCSGAVTVPGCRCPGRFAKATTRTPPSCRLPLPSQWRVGGWSLGALVDPALLGVALFLAFRTLSEQPAGGAAVVACKQDQRVVAEVLFVQFDDDPPDLVVEHRGHSGAGSPVLVLDVRVAGLLQ